MRIWKGLRRMLGMKAKGVDLPPHVIETRNTVDAQEREMRRKVELLEAQTRVMMRKQ